MNKKPVKKKVVAKKKDNRGGARPGAGRKRGSVQIASTADKQALAIAARQLAEDCLNQLIDIAWRGESDAARVTAIKEILDRGYGKPSQDIDIGNPEGEEFKVDAGQKIIDILNAIAKKKAKE